MLMHEDQVWVYNVVFTQGLFVSRWDTGFLIRVYSSNMAQTVGGGVMLDN